MVGNAPGVRINLKSCITSHFPFAPPQRRAHTLQIMCGIQIAVQCYAGAYPSTANHLTFLHSLEAKKDARGH